MFELSDAEHFLQNNREQILIVRDYLIMSEFDSITISRPFVPRGESINMDTIEMFTGLEHGHVPVKDEAFIEALLHLFQYSSVIAKNGNGVNFLIWSARNHGRGIVYSIDGNTPDESSGLVFLTHIEPLSEEGWYFYDENFYTWRSRRNQD